MVTMLNLNKGYAQDAYATAADDDAKNAQIAVIT
jgi:hypothetical protein